jgi:hypothetical protein
VDLSETDTVLSVGWATGKMNLGEFADIALPKEDDDDGGEEVEPPVVSPDTGVSMAEGLIPCLMLFGCVLGVRRILWA